jgi:hypothetical protein
MAADDTCHDGVMAPTIAAHVRKGQTWPITLIRYRLLLPMRSCTRTCLFLNKLSRHKASSWFGFDETRTMRIR